MKLVPWILVAIGAGVAAYVFINQPGLQYSTGSDAAEAAADRTALWGSKQRLSGKGRGGVGKLKEGVGRATGDDQLADEGVADRVVGKAKDVVGEVAQVAGDTIHNLNR